MSQIKKIHLEILKKVKEYYQEHTKENIKKFNPKESKLNYAGRIYDEQEMVNLVDSSLEFWLTYGRYSKQFEAELAEFLDIKYALLVNSGSSANLLAFMALTSPLLKDRQIKKGDEVITIACGFPTTVSPIMQYGAVPVFIDVDLTGNLDVSYLEKALSNKTKAVMAAHTLGNPFDVKSVKDFCNKHNLWLIEDNCDALGSIYNNKYTGTLGDIGTSSFYPPHHMTMGEGGAVYTNNPILNKIMLSMRDWGRDCWCESGVDNTCKARFSNQFGSLPFGYDHKYVYSHLGYNLKATDMQAAIGCAQLKKLNGFIEKRRLNHAKLFNRLKKFEDYFILPIETGQSKPSWFGFLIIIKDNSKFSRNDITEYLEKNNIQTRNLFGGNLTRQPLFDDFVSDKDYKIIGELKNTDKIMNDGFWIGVYPGINDEMSNYIIETFENFIKIYLKR